MVTQVTDRTFTYRTCMYCMAGFGCAVLEEGGEFERLECAQCPRIGTDDCALSNYRQVNKHPSVSVCRRNECRKKLDQVGRTQQSAGV